MQPVPRPSLSCFVLDRGRDRDRRGGPTRVRSSKTARCNQSILTISYKTGFHEPKHQTSIVLTSRSVRGLSEAWLVALCSCCVCLLSVVPSVFVASGNKFMMI